MNLLLDTHTVIWYYDGSPMLSTMALSAVEDENNQLFLSAASFIEMPIKVSLGKLKLSAPIATILASYLDNDAVMVNITPAYGMALETMPFHHRDPFDRLIVAQALAEDFTLISRDDILDQYGVKRIWD